MNRQELPRIRLKVATDAGINILCTALRTWKVVQWLPHIQQAYREVKEDQEGDEDSKKRFIKAIRIKKGNFYIANSELIGDIFQDNDEVQCEISFPQMGSKNKSKKDKKNQKKNKKQEALNRNEDSDYEIEQDKDKEKQANINDKSIDIKNSQNSRKKLMQEIQKQSNTNTQKQPKKSVKDKKEPSLAPITKQSKKSPEKQSEIHPISLKQTLMKNIDFSKLKSILNPKKDSKILQPKESQVKVQHFQGESSSEEGI